MNPTVQHNTKEADQSISSFVGENYEYIRTIVSNSIEIKKLELVDQSTNWIGKIIVGLLLVIILLLLSIVLLVMFAFAINIYIDNLLISFGILSIVLAIIAFFIHFFFRNFLYRKISQKILTLTNLNENPEK